MIQDSSALAWVALLMRFLPMAIKGVNEAAELVGWGTDKIHTMIAEKRDPTENEWDVLHAKMQVLHWLLPSI